VGFVLAQRSAGAHIHGVRAGSRLRERVGRNPLTARQLGQVALLLVLRSVPNERKRADAGLRSKGRGEARQHGDVVGNQRGGDLVHAHAAVFLRNVHGSKAQLGGLDQRSPQSPRRLGLDGLGGGENFVACKLGGGRGNLALLLVQLFRGKDFGRGARFQQKTAACGGHDGRSRKDRHGDISNCQKQYDRRGGMGKFAANSPNLRDIHLRLGRQMGLT